MKSLILATTITITSFLSTEEPEPPLQEYIKEEYITLESITKEVEDSSEGDYAPYASKDKAIEHKDKLYIESIDDNNTLNSKLNKTKSINKDLSNEVDRLQKEIDSLKKEVIKAKESAKKEEVKVSNASSNKSASSKPVTSENKAVGGRTFNATYYSAFCPTCGEWGGITATGDDISSSIFVRGKRVVAVDPSVIPLGSTVRVTTPNESFDALALDTGGDIKGNRIDILVESTEKAYSIGRHNVQVQIIK